LTLDQGTDRRLTGEPEEVVMSQTVRTLTGKMFDEEVGSSAVPVVVEFWAEWCPPCKTIASVLDSIASDYEGRLQVFKVNTDEHPELAGRYEVMSVPTILAFHDGELRHRMTGARSRARVLEELFDLLTE
jgi:thioredoxin 1